MRLFRLQPRRRCRCRLRRLSGQGVIPGRSRRQDCRPRRGLPCLLSLHLRQRRGGSLPGGQRGGLSGGNAAQRDIGACGRRRRHAALRGLCFGSLLGLGGHRARPHRNLSRVPVGGQGTRQLPAIDLRRGDVRCSGGRRRHDLAPGDGGRQLVTPRVQRGDLHGQIRRGHSFQLGQLVGAQRGLNCPRRPYRLGGRILHRYSLRRSARAGQRGGSRGGAQRPGGQSHAGFPRPALDRRQAVRLTGDHPGLSCERDRDAAVSAAADHQQGHQE